MACEKTNGKTITLFLKDGMPTGRIKCRLGNWTGVAYKIPRTEIDNSKTISNLNNSGVYFLFSTSDETQDNIVYVGQAVTRKNGEGGIKMGSLSTPVDPYFLLEF